MLDYRHNSNNKDSEEYNTQFWNKLIKTLFIFGVSIIVIMIALKWFGLID